MLKSEQESMDMNKAMMQSLEGCSMGVDYLNGLNLRRGTESPSHSNTSIPQSVNDLLGGIVNPSQLMANNMDPQMASFFEQVAALQSQIFTPQSLPFLSNQPIPSATPSKAYCDLCDKTFLDEGFLRGHKMSKHGKTIDEEGSPVKGMEESPSSIEGGEGERNSTVIKERTSVEGTSTDRREMKEEDNGVASIEMEGMGTSSSTSKCDECSFESDNFILLLHHKATHLKMENELVNTVTPPSSFSCSDCDQSFESASLLSNHSAIAHTQFGSLLGSMFGGGEAAPFPAFLLNQQLPNPFSSLTNTPPLVKPPPAKRNYSSAGKNYCDVCNKEVCNKYFLRTHMLKMHGIVIDENKPVIANIDTRERERTGELTFRCDICSTTLTSRQQLRDHKQSAHGVSYPVGTPSTPSALSTPTRPTKTTSVITGPPMMISSLSTPSISTLDLSSLNNESATTCIDNSPPPTLISDVMVGLPSVSVVRETKELNGVPIQGVSKCQHCLYTTRFARNMEYHVERHERLNDVDGMRSGVKMDEMLGGEEEKLMERNSDDDVIMRMTTNAAIQMAKTNETFECTKCHRSFSSQSFLNSHTKLFHSEKIMSELAAWIAHKKKIGSTKLRMKMPRRLKSGFKRNLVAEKDNDVHGVERHSVTSGSISPLRCDVAEGISSCDSGYSLQSVVVSTPLGLPLPSQFTARLPFSSSIQSPLTLTLTLTPIFS